MKIKTLFSIVFFILFCTASICVFADTASTHPASADTARHTAATTVSPAQHPDMWNFPNYHPLVVHFPIVLLIFAAFMQLLAHWKKELNLSVLILLVCGTAGAWLAASVFDANPLTKALSPEARQIFRMHHQYSDYTTWLATLALLLKTSTFFVKKGKTAVELLTLIVLTGAAITVSAAGHYGSYLVHIEGVGPKGNLLQKE
jgi:uncharacterized membrane protein